MAEVTPMMQQYQDIKEQNSDAILFFRLGDFYEMFNEDAFTASRELDLTLTTRDRGKAQEDQTPMCGVPYHSAESYIARLVSKGYKVAVCEQMEDPALAKGIVKRNIVRVVSQGTAMESSMLEEGRNNYICGVYCGCQGYGLCFIDISTGQACATTSHAEDYAINEVFRFSPSEVVLNDGVAEDSEMMKLLSARSNCRREKMPSVEPEAARALVEQHFGKDNALAEVAILSLGGLLEYLHRSQKNDLSHIDNLDYYVSGRFMELDLNTRRNLEITETLRSREKKGTLLWVLDSTKTPMGGRLLRSWLEKPLLSVANIQRRSGAVEELANNSVMRNELRLALREINDLERLMGRISFGSANARDLRALATTGALVPGILEKAKTLTSKRACEITAAMDPLESVTDIICHAIVDEPPITVREGGLIRDGYDPEVDKLRTLLNNSQGAIADIEARERQRTGIQKLKTGYNHVFGYYIEVNKSFSSQVPEDYIRKQTTANAERYITQELKELERTILSAGDRITTLEYNLFNKVRETIASYAITVQRTSAALAELDVLCSLAEVAVNNNYCMPEVDTSSSIEIRDGRHPVVEKVLKDSLFVPNDTVLNSTSDLVQIITGPNMAGKSTYMRQVALITLMAQIGSFVPAKYARIGIVDRIFTRIGASDDLSTGQSTFMVEMQEVADILKYASSKSLLILDEIGRGTSTFDGMAIARAVLEHAADKKRLGAKTLFATHYHELTAMEDQLSGVKNYNIAVKKRGDEIIFLRKILRGGADDSYGVQVAKLAGVPDRVIRRAKEILAELEGSGAAAPAPAPAGVQDTQQISLSDVEGSLITQRLEATDLNTLTPIEAMNLLFELKNMLSDRK